MTRCQERYHSSPQKYRSQSEDTASRPVLSPQQEEVCLAVMQQSSLFPGRDTVTSSPAAQGASP